MNSRQFPLDFLNKVPTELSSVDFKKFKNIIELRIICSDIECVDGNVFKDIPNLKRLYLFNNHIKKIDEDTFEYIPNVECISLAGNEISFIHNYAFRNLKYLFALDLSNNDLTSLPYLKDNRHLNNLYIYKNHLNIMTIKSSLPNKFINDNDLIDSIIKEQK